MNNSTIARAGSILFALVIGYFGLGHFLNASAMSGIVPKFLPVHELLVYLAGAILVAGALAILLNKYVKPACLLLAALLIIFVLTIHIPGLINNSDPGMRASITASLLKDAALAGAALVIAGKGV